MITSEKNLTQVITKYLQIKHRDVIFKIDLASDQKLSIQQAKRNSALLGRWSKGYPDLFIAEARHGYHGLYIEIKTEKANPFKKDGTLKKNEHLETQNHFLEILRDKGYYATFGVGYDSCIDIIEQYLAIT